MPEVPLSNMHDVSTASVMLLVRRLQFLSSSASTHRSLVTQNRGGLWGGGEAGLVLISRSTDVYQNLALEDWIEANVDLQRQSVLLLWRNRPTVVIGRHQNPWVECNLPIMRQNGVSLARRRSGGGTVFHDLGNLNLTFFTSKKAYDRQRNLRVITEALKQLQPGLQVEATNRFDIILEGRYKISGSASRLSRISSYHHCTLLHSANRSALISVLRPTCPGIISNATPSVPSPIANLLDYIPSLQWEELLEALTHQYNKEFGFRSPLTPVDPGDVAKFPGLCGMASELYNWNWTFGKTPKFSVQTRLALRDSSYAELSAEVKNGVIESCKLDVPAEWLPKRLSRDISCLLVGQRFCPNHTAVAITALMQSETRELRHRLQELFHAMSTVMG